MTWAAVWREERERIRAEVLAEVAAALEDRRCGYRDCDECKCRAENAALVRYLSGGAA